MPWVYAQSGGTEGGISVERHTKRLDDGQAVTDCQSCKKSRKNQPELECTDTYCIDRLADRVAAYEDTGLEPQEIEKIRQNVEAGFLKQAARRYGIDVSRIRELVQADRDGRCVVLPCKEGDKLRRDGTEFTADHWNLILTAFADDKSTKSGKRVGLFGAKEAEAALKASDVT